MDNEGRRDGDTSTTALVPPEYWRVPVACTGLPFDIIDQFFEAFRERETYASWNGSEDFRKWGKTYAKLSIDPLTRIANSTHTGAHSSGHPGQYSVLALYRNCHHIYKIEWVLTTFNLKTDLKIVPEAAKTPSGLSIGSWRSHFFYIYHTTTKSFRASNSVGIYYRNVQIISRTRIIHRNTLRWIVYLRNEGWDMIPGLVLNDPLPSSLHPEGGFTGYAGKKPPLSLESCNQACISL